MIVDVIDSKKGADKHPFVVGLTGGIASGKSTVADLFHRLYGVCVVDADLVSREVVAIGEPALAEIKVHFGPAALSADGSLNRAYLKSCIFNDERERQWLNNLLHPIIRERMAQQLSGCQGSYALAVIPLLTETGTPDYVDFVLVVDCSFETQYQRLLQRDAIDDVLAKSILQTQATREARLRLADGVIENEIGLDEQKLIQQVSHWHRFLLTLVEQHSHISNTSDPRTNT